VCGKCVGEINFDAIIKIVKCGYCNKIDIDNEMHRSSKETSHSFIAVAC
jgi:hypothetical protein